MNINKDYKNKIDNTVHFKLFQKKKGCVKYCLGYISIFTAIHNIRKKEIYLKFNK